MASNQRVRSDDDKVIDSTDSIVRVIVSEYLTKTTFNVHKKLLESSSEWMRKALVHASSAEIPKCKAREVSEALAFKIYVDWLYTGFIACRDKNEDTSSKAWEYRVLIQLHDLGMQLEDQAFQDVVMNAFLEKVQEGAASVPPKMPGLTVLNIVFSPLTSRRAKDTLGQILVEAYARDGSKSDVANIRAVMQPHGKAFFFAELSLVLCDLRKQKSPGIAGASGCDFHSHASGDECQADTQTKKRRRLA